MNHFSAFSFLLALLCSTTLSALSGEMCKALYSFDDKKLQITSFLTSTLFSQLTNLVNTSLFQLVDMFFFNKIILSNLKIFIYLFN